MNTNINISDICRENIVRVLSAYASKQVIDAALNNSTSVESGPHLVNSTNKIQVEKYPNGDQYEGEFNEKGLRHGKGVYTSPRFLVSLIL